LPWTKPLARCPTHRQPQALALQLPGASDVQLARLQLVGGALLHLELASPLALGAGWAAGLQRLACLSLAGCSQLVGASLAELRALPQVRLPLGSGDGILIPGCTGTADLGCGVLCLHAPREQVQLGGWSGAAGCLNPLR
jgi:hypothetical protein